MFDKMFPKTLAVFLAAAVASLLATTGAVSPEHAGVSANVLSWGQSGHAIAMNNESQESVPYNFASVMHYRN